MGSTIGHAAASAFPRAEGQLQGHVDALPPSIHARRSTVVVVYASIAFRSVQEHTASEDAHKG
jgi:hypothetical protein